MIDFSNIKLVVSDMDSTLLNSKGEVSNRFFKLFKQLQEKNITFCAASGRQHNSIVSKLQSIKDNIYVIAENGAIAMQGKEVLLLNSIASEKVLKLIPTLREVKDIHIVLCTQNGAFIESKDKQFISLFEEYYNSYEIVDDLMEVAKNTSILKIAVYHFESSEKHIYPAVAHLGNDVLLKISSKNWLDISVEKANKGNALKLVQERLNVSKKETMVFGDYHNDIEMMQESDLSFAMENAHKDIKEIAKYTTKSNDNFGVEVILEELVANRS
jgi:Cof subfamily protein (haloacid dehalogenase superfamily)